MFLFIVDHIIVCYPTQIVNVILLSDRKSNGNPFATGYTLLCGWKFEHVDDITFHVSNDETFLRYSNSDTPASELLENLEDWRLSSNSGAKTS